MADSNAIGFSLKIDDGQLKKLDEIDKKINQIATDSDNMAKVFTSAMSKMGTGADGLLKKLQTMQSAISKLDISKFAQGVQNVGRGTTQVEQFAAAIAKAAAAINKYNAENRKRTDVDNSKQIAQLNKEIEAMHKRTQQLEEYIAKQREAGQGGRRGGSSGSGTNADTKALNAYNRAMAASEALVTQRINKIAKLRNAEEQLRNASGNYATQLNRINQEIARLNRLNEGQVDSYGRVIRSQRNLVNTSQQLTRQLALLFSVSQIQGYINKLVEVRGEFELQNTALASILQNKDQADQLFSQITELAVRSPFTIRELTTYSKQLAAYQIQYEDLYDTTKMLADVSAGLGVSMDRLILAFGQVKAANILRGTEVRQFTEAGLNILAELAKYYSELEGRMVSVGEVQDMVTRRMVSFGDVEEIFRRVTSAGGIFYDMQNQQADTLRGQMMNLQDQIDLMLNDIGKSNQGVISEVISLLKSVIENWETIAQVMTPILGMLTLYLTTTKLLSSGVGVLAKAWALTKTNVLLAVGAINQAEAAQRGFNKATRLNAWVAIGSVLATIIWEVVAALRAMGKEQEELNKIASQGAFDYMSSSAQYERLANIVVDATESYENQQKALSDLRRIYGDILPQHYLEADAIRAMKGNYDEATNAIENYIRAKTQERQLSYISEEYGNKVADAQERAAKDLQDQVKSIYDAELKMSEINVIMAKFRKEFDDGLIKSPKEATQRMNELLSEFLKMDIGIRFMRNSMYEYYYALDEMDKKTNDVIEKSTIAWGDRITLELGERRKELEKTFKEVRSLLNVVSAQGQVGEDGALITQKQIDDAKAKLIQITSAWGVEASYISNLTDDAFQIKQATVELNKAALRSFVKELQSMETDAGNIASVNKFIESINAEIASLDNTPFQNFVSEIIKGSAEINKISLGNLVDVFANTGESVSDYTKRIKNEYESLMETISLYEQSPYLVPQWSGEEDYLLNISKSKVLEDLLSRIQPQKDTGGGSSKNPELEKLKEQISLIEKAAKEYENYSKLFNEQTAQQKTEDAFRQAFENLGLDVSMDFDASGVIDALRNLFNTAGDEGNQILTEKIATKQTGVETEKRTKEVEEYRKQIDELFASLSNYQELEKLGLNKDLISQLFGINVSSINDVQDVFEKIKTELKKYGDEGEKLISESEKKITDAQQKEIQDRMKKYATYLTKQYSEIANIRIKLQKEMYEVDTLDMSDVQKQSIKQRLQDEANKQIQKLTWEDFKASDMYTQMFDDLDKVSTKGLDYMVERLEELKGTLTDLDPTELKEIIKAINDIKEEQLSRNPLEGIGEDVKEALDFAKQRKELEEQITAEYEKQKELRTQIPQQEQNVENARSYYGQMSSVFGKDSAQANIAKGILDSQEKSLSNIKKDLTNSENKATKLKKQYDEGAEAAARIAQRTAEFAEKMNIAVQSMSNLVDGMNSLFNMSDGFNDVTSSLMDFGTNLGNTVASAGSAFASFATGNIFGGITSGISAIGGLFSAIGSLFSIGDKKKERQIQRQLELVENLQKAYEKLEEAIDNAYSIDQLNSASDQAEANLREQAAALEKAIKLEEDKKKTDKDKLKEYQQQLEDVYDQLEELQQEKISKVTNGILDDVLSAADEFTNAWLESFREVGDGMDGLNENFQSMLEDMLKRQASMLITGTYIDQWKKELEKYINADDLELTAGEAKNWVDAVTSSLPGLNQALEEYFKAMQDAGFDLTGEGEGDTLTGLSKSIAGITEQQADALAALCESIRYFTSDSNLVLHNLYNAFQAPTEENPFLAELRVQSEQLRLLYGLWNGVIKNSSGKGRVVRVELV